MKKKLRTLISLLVLISGILYLGKFYKSDIVKLREQHRFF